MRGASNEVQLEIVIIVISLEWSVGTERTACLLRCSLRHAPSSCSSPLHVVSLQISSSEWAEQGVAHIPTQHSTQTIVCIRLFGVLFARR